MIKHILFALLFVGTIPFVSIGQQSPDEGTKSNHSVSEVLKLLKGEWRQQYKIIDGSIFYDRKYSQTATGTSLVVDTSAIHIFTIDTRGRTNYVLNWEESPGTLKFGAGETTEGSWDLKQVPSGVEIIIRDAYFKGCPELKRRVSRINNKQLLLFDPETGDNYYMTRR